MEHNADVNAQNNLGYSPLHLGIILENLNTKNVFLFWFLAAWYGPLDVVRLILSKNCDVKSKTQTGATAVHKG